MQNPTTSQHAATPTGQNAAVFVMSLVFLLVPLLVGSPMLREAIRRVQGIVTYGWSAGDSLLLVGMSVSLIFFLAAPLAAFAWGQVAAWSHRVQNSGAVILYGCLSVVYAAVALTMLASQLRFG